jgi:hypothetical protein
MLMMRTSVKNEKELISGCLLVALCWVTVGVITSNRAAGQQPSVEMVDPNSPFVLHLQDPPWIKEIHFRMSQVFAIGKTPGLTETNVCGIESLKAALQPNGMYFERITTAFPKGTPMMRMAKKRGGGGISEDDYWSAFWGGDAPGDMRTITSEPRRPELGASGKNGVHGSMEIQRKQLQMVRFFGFPELRPNSFNLTGQDQFQAVTADDQVMHGKILTVSRGRPLTLKYTIPGRPEGSIAYQYDGDETLPDYFVLVLRQGGKFVGGTPRTNWIEHAEYGLDDKNTNGYPAAMVFGDIGRFNHVVVWSNGVDYQVGPKGRMFVNGHAKPGQQRAFTGVAMRRSVLGRAFTLFLVFLSAMAAWAVLRQHKADRPAT